MESQAIPSDRCLVREELSLRLMTGSHLFSIGGLARARIVGKQLHAFQSPLSHWERGRG